MKALDTPKDVHAHLQGEPGALMIHVLPAEVFAARRIPGSHNACVYEVTFLEQVQSIASSKVTSLVLYGAGDGTQDARCAAEKLAAAGYTNLAVFEGGLKAWETAGEELEAQADLPAAPRLNGRYRINAAESVVRWTGRNLFNHHHGTLKLKEGELQFSDDRLIDGRIILDMNSIACEDITDAATNAVLIRHLRDADFFLVDRFPIAEFVLREAARIAGSTEGTPNWRVGGDFTLRGVTRPLAIPAVVAAASAERVTAQAQIEIDRTEFGSVYGSGRFFRFLGRHVVNDHIHLHLKLHADRLEP